MEQQMEQQEQMGQEQQAAPEEGMDLTANAMQGKMQIPPNLQKAYEKIVLAGLKFMFSPESHEAALQKIEAAEGPIQERVAHGIVGLMAMLFAQSNKTMPPQLIVPAAVTLYMHAIEFFIKSGEPVEKEAVGDGMYFMLKTLLEKMGIPQEQLAKLFGGGLDTDAVSQKAEQQGLIGGAMQQGGV